MSSDPSARAKLKSICSAVFTGSPDDERSDDEDEQVDSKKN